ILFVDIGDLVKRQTSRDGVKLHDHSTCRCQVGLDLPVVMDRQPHDSTRLKRIPTTQCPMYFAYKVRALSTSLVPLMIARPSGKTVNSKPPALNFRRKRL